MLQHLRKFRLTVPIKVAIVGDMATTTASKIMRSWSDRIQSGTFNEGAVQPVGEDNFSHFTFQGDALDYGTSGWPFYTPVWRVHLSDGSWFDYTAGWQSGRAPSVGIVRRSS